MQGEKAGEHPFLALFPSELSAQLVAKRDTKGEAKGYKENDSPCRFLGVWKLWEVRHELILGRV